MLMTLTPSLPSVINTTTITPRIILADAEPTIPIARQNQGRVKERFVQVSKIQPVLIEVGEALRFFRLYCSYNIIGSLRDYARPLPFASSKLP
jgi:hypothetical protein